MNANEMNEKCLEIYRMAKDGDLDRLGMRSLPIEEDWLLEEEVQFPSRPFVVRGPNANRIYSWSDRLFTKWNDGDVNPEDFIKEEHAFNQIENRGEDFGYGNSRTISFELPRTEVNIIKHPAVNIMSAAGIAANGGWCTLGHIEWSAGESIAKHISGKKVWFISSEVNAALKLYDITSFSSLYDFLTEDEVRRKRGSGCLEEKLFYHVPEPNDIIVQPSFGVHAVVTAPSYKDGKLTWALVSGYEAI